MTIDKVIELGESIQKPDYGLLHNFTGATWVAIIIFFTLGIFAIAISKSTHGEGQFGTLLCLVSVGIIMFKVINVGYYEDRDYEKKIDEWRETVAVPFIESLPREKKEVVFIKIEPELAVKSSRYSGYTYAREIRRTPVSFSYKDDDGIATETNWIETRMDLTDEEKPFVEFQKLEKDLGHGVEAGNYNYKINLPDSYEFTEIK